MTPLTAIALGLGLTALILILRRPRRAMRPETTGKEEPGWQRTERARLQARRAAASPPLAKDAPEVGLALSGGGIRSATFNLGVLRALGRAELIGRFDYLSTVSGGGYVGAMLCSLYVPTERRGAGQQPGSTAAAAPVVPADPFKDERGRRALEHLRQNGRWLVPGSADLLRLFFLIARNTLAVHFVIGLTLLTLFVFLKASQLLLAQWRWIDVQLAGADPLFWPGLWLRGYPLHHWVIASWLIYLSALAAAPAVVAGATYWLTGRRGAPDKRWKRIFGEPAPWSFIIAALLGWCLASGLLAPGLAAARAAGAVIGGTAAAAFLFYMVAEVLDWWTGGAGLNAEMQEDRVRTRLTACMQRWARLALAVFLLGVVDTVAGTLYVRQSELAMRLAAAGGIVAVAVPLVRILLQKVMAGGGGWLGGIAGRYLRPLLLAVGLFLAFLVAVFWSAVADALVWQGGPIGQVEHWGAAGEVARRIGLLVLALAVLSGLVWLSPAFVNLSTYANFYASRLRVAYLGATNAKRHEKRRDDGIPPGDDHPRDDIRLEDYYAAPGGPVHLINIAINDTASRSSNLTRLDRHAKPFTVSPAGFLYPEGDPNEVRVLAPFREFDNMPLSLWIGVSGAAVSTGVGYLGGTGLSLVAGLVNLRLGYWWQQGSGAPSWRHGTQWMLWRELTRGFPGTDGARWYLSDGAHFENSGVYELVRRRVPVIVATDCGQDPNYRFEDLTRLMRLIRIDFDAHLEFLDKDRLDRLLGDDSAIRRVFAPLDGLGLRDADDDRPPQIGPYAALGCIRYADGAPPSTLILIKPRICGSEMPDMLAYWRANPDFPQQTTLDQIYDEAQWESYYRLGELITERLFTDADAAWRPRDLRPLP